MLLGNGFLPDIPRSLNCENLTAEELAIRGGFVDKTASGVYGLLPNGNLIFAKITNMIHDALRKVGGQEYVPPQLLPREMLLDEAHGRVDRFEDEIFSLPQLNGRFCLYPTGEEYFLDITKKSNPRLEQLPILLFSTDNRFRVSRSSRGMIRSHSFLLNEVFCLTRSNEDSIKVAQDIVKIYSDIFDKLGISYSIEERVDLENGKTSYDFVFLYDQNGTEVPLRFAQVNLLGDSLTRIKELSFAGDGVEKIYPHMVGAGISLNRLFIGLIQTHRDSTGIAWPAAIAPYDISIVAANANGKVDANNKMMKAIDALCGRLAEIGVSVLPDVRDKSLGYKCATSEVVGSTLLAVVGEKELEDGFITLKQRGVELGTFHIDSFPEMVLDRIIALKNGSFGIEQGVFDGR